MSRAMGETPYIEANALLAIQADDGVKARRLLRTLLPGERRRLARAAVQLADACRIVDEAGREHEDGER